MRLTFPIYLALALLSFGCKSKTEMVMLGPPGQRFEPVQPESIYVFTSQDRVLVKHQPLARISVGFNYGTSSDADAVIVFKCKIISSSWYTASEGHW